MTFKAKLSTVLDRADVISLAEETSLGEVWYEHLGKVHDNVGVSFESDDGDLRFGPFDLAAEIEIDDEGQATLTTIGDEQGETSSHKVCFQRTVPLNASHLN